MIASIFLMTQGLFTVGLLLLIAEIGGIAEELFDER
jgi:hypothetical protein